VPRLLALDRQLSIEQRIERADDQTLRQARANLPLLLRGGYVATSKRILLIDDESYNCKALLAILRSLKLRDLERRVALAYSGKAALREVEASLVRREDGHLECEIGLILSDCSMPRMDGYECTAKILELLSRRGVRGALPKIYAVTGHVEPEYKEKAI
jgi:CheY-like chemotaxis protein